MRVLLALASNLLFFFLFYPSGTSLLLPAAGPISVAPNENHDWAVWGGGSENSHYSPLAQINRANVKQLEVAWSFDTGEEAGLQTSPSIVDGVLYGITPTQKGFGLDASTGKVLWKLDSGIQDMPRRRGF